MSEEVYVRFTPGSSDGIVSGPWSSTAAVNRGRWRVISVGYTVLAASVGPELRTNSIAVHVLDAGPGVVIDLTKALPTTSQLVSTVNEAISEKYAGYSGELPQYVKRSDGYYWFNPTPQDFTVTFQNSNQQQLWLGTVLSPTEHTITVDAGTRVGPYSPDSKLGAVAQTLTLNPSGGYRLDLPLVDSYRKGAMIYFTNETAQLTSALATGVLTVTYPSIDARVKIYGDVSTSINIVTATHLP